MTLTPLLKRATNDDLGPLVEYLTGRISEHFTGRDVYQKHYPNHQKYVDVIESELRRYGGNTIANIFRGEGPPYDEIVHDVAKKLDVDFSDTDSIEEIEIKMLFKVLERSYEDMSDAEKKELAKLFADSGVENADFNGGFPAATITAQLAGTAGGFATYQIAVIVANKVSYAVLGKGLSMAANAAITRSIGYFLGPVGWAVSGLLAVGTITGPAYRVTIPCVLHVAYLRQKLKQE
ncbi:MAG: hypothetical protein F4Y91_01985 [Gemmatimonadetes bacterium]|nr:hypothetical protein [Gemmatimonadota bacterium]MYB67521.1 hypothetical protein [Gemmatimonadota bacterium]